jgi:hypothetical protein
MRGLSDDERRALVPIGEPGEHVPDAVFVALIERGLGAWVPEGDTNFWQPTSLGELAVRLDAAARGGMP